RVNLLFSVGVEKNDITGQPRRAPDVVALFRCLALGSGLAHGGAATSCRLLARTVLGLDIRPCRPVAIKVRQAKVWEAEYRPLIGPPSVAGIAARHLLGALQLLALPGHLVGLRDLAVGCDDAVVVLGDDR